MRITFYILLPFLLILESCAQESRQTELALDQQNMNHAESAQQSVEQLIIDPNGTTVKSRILPPVGFKRTVESEHSFPEYLRNLPLKPYGAHVLYYDGSTKANNDTYAAVVDMAIGKKDLHQCADAVMRLRAEYLWHEKRYNDIHYNFTNGFRVDYANWMKGKRMVIDGNKTYWVDKRSPSNTYQDFWAYMELIFTYAGTLSLSKELAPVELKDIRIGDVFIRGGSPGHAVIVIDMAENPNTDEKVFLLAQSYMPAQETQILQNPVNPDLSPWYALSEVGEKLYTPEWTFSTKDLKRFKE